MRQLTRAAIIAALYIALVFAFQFASFGPIQLRVAESLTLLPMIYPEAVAGIYVGTLLANILGGMGPWDIFGGSLVSLLAAYITYRYRRHPVIPYASPIVLNALLVSLYLRLFFEVPSYWLLVLSIGLGQSVVVLGLGLPLLHFLKKHQDRFL